MQTVARPQSLRLATWNLWWRFDDWAERLHRISAVLSELRADVVGLQEVWPDGAENQAARLARGPVVPGQLLVNAWRYHALPIPPAWNPANPYVAITREPAATIDHILVGRSPSWDRGWIERVGVFAAGPTESGWASDHAGVWADIAA